MKRTTLVLAALLVPCAFACASCGKIREKLGQKAVETTTGGTVTVANGGTTTVSDPKTGTTIVAGTTLPDGWPSNVPVYAGATISASMGTPAGKTVVASTPDSPQKVHDFYKGQLKSLKLLNDIEAGGSKVLTFKDGGKTISITITPSGSATQVTLSVAGA